MGKHAIVHVEFPAQDPKVASQFYSDLFGWKQTVAPEFDYYMFAGPEGTGGGFNKLADQSEGGFSVKPGEVLVYISTDDIEASLARAEELGGKTVAPKMEIPGMGWYAVFTDPTGNQVGLFTYLERENAA